MTHLEYEQLLSLAECAVGEDGFDDEQIQQLEHLKTCKECYEKFCLLTALTDVMSESGSYVLSASAVKNPVKESVLAISKKILATLSVIRNNAQDAVNVVMNQIEQAGSALQFGPSLAMATRGANAAESSMVRLEEFEDEKTYIVFNPDKNELVVQINLQKTETENVHVYLTFDDLTVMDLPLTKRGHFVKGILTGIPEKNFKICIECE